MHEENNNAAKNSELGKKSHYEAQYNPEKLFTIPRILQRKKMGISDTLPFFGYDIWNHYEVSWLNPKGKPMVAIATISYPCESVNIIESKSMKLYFNTFNNSHFESPLILEKIIQKDIESRIEAPVTVSLKSLNDAMYTNTLPDFEATNIDHLDIVCQHYEVSPHFLYTQEEQATESLCSNLLKSNCLVTGQPDWASVYIAYSGKKISHEGLLSYLISYRNHNEFHEQCIERIFHDIQTQCQPKSLTVYGRFTRRGGLDINPLRTTNPHYVIENNRLVRQ